MFMGFFQSLRNLKAQVDRMASNFTVANDVMETRAENTDQAAITWVPTQLLSPSDTPAADNTADKHRKRAKIGS